MPWRRVTDGESDHVPERTNRKQRSYREAEAVLVYNKAPCSGSSSASIQGPSAPGPSAAEPSSSLIIAVPAPAPLSYSSPSAACTDSNSSENKNHTSFLTSPPTADARPTTIDSLVEHGGESAPPRSNDLTTTATVPSSTTERQAKGRILPAAAATRPTGEKIVAATTSGGIKNPAAAAGATPTTAWTLSSTVGQRDFFNNAEEVIVMNKHGHPADATVMSVNKIASPPLFKLRFKDRRKKEIWLPATALTAAVGGAPVPPSSAATIVPVAVAAISASSSSNTSSDRAAVTPLDSSPSVTSTDSMGTENTQGSSLSSSMPLAPASTTARPAERGNESAPPQNNDRAIAAIPHSTKRPHAKGCSPLGTATIYPAGEKIIAPTAAGGIGDPAAAAGAALVTAPVASSTAGQTDSFNITDTVIVMNKHGHRTKAIVVSVNSSASPPLFKLRFNDRRKKETWMPATALTAAVEGASASPPSFATAAPVVAAAVICASRKRNASSARAAAAPLDSSPSATPVDCRDIENTQGSSLYLLSPAPSSTNTGSMECGDESASPRSNKRAVAAIPPSTNSQPKAPTPLGAVATRLTGETSVKAASGGGIGDPAAGVAAAPMTMLAASSTAALKDSFNITDKVTIVNKHGHLSDATVVSVDDTASPPLFKIRFKDRRKKEIWMPATALTTAVGGASVSPPSTVTAVSLAPVVAISGSGSSNTSSTRATATPLDSSPSATPVDSRGINNTQCSSLSSSKFPAPSSKTDWLAECEGESEAPRKSDRVVAATPPSRNKPRAKQGTPAAAIVCSAGESILQPTREGVIDYPAAVAGEAPTKAPATSTTLTRKDSFDIADGVVVVNKNGHIGNATIMSVDKTASPPLFKLRFTDRRKKEIWLPATALIAAVNGAPASLPFTAAVVPDVTAASTSASGGSSNASSAAAAAVAVVTTTPVDAPLSIAPADSNGTENTSQKYSSSSASSFSALASTSDSPAGSGEESAPTRSNDSAIAVVRSSIKKRQEKGHAPHLNITCALSENSVEAVGGRDIDDPAAAMRAAPATTPATSSSTPQRDSFNIADMVIVMNKHGHPADATVVSVNNAASPPLFKLRFKDKRKKEIWMPATALIAAIGGTPAPLDPSAAADVTASSSSSSSNPVSTGNESGKRGIIESPIPAGRPRDCQPREKTAGAPDLPASTLPTQQRRVAAGGAGGSGLHSQSHKRKESSSDGKTSTTSTGLSNRNRVEDIPDSRGRISSVSQPPRRKAATAAAGAISASSKSVRRKKSDRERSTETANHGAPSGEAKRGQRSGKVSSSRVAFASPSDERTHRTPGLSGKKRVRLVTPGFAFGGAAGSLPAEPALRATHPTEGIRRRWKFIIQQPRKRTTSQPPENSSSGGNTTSDAVASNKTKLRQPLRRPLLQPSYQLNAPENPQQQQKNTADGWVDSGVRRGGRVRKLLYSRLCEDGLGAAAFGGVESGDEDEQESGKECDREADSEKAKVGGTRFFKSNDAPWGSGAQPLVKVELSLSKDRQPLLAEQSALAVVTFVADRHKYSAEQLCNVLVAEGFLCFCDEENKVFVLTVSDSGPQRDALSRVRELAMERCGVQVEASPWLDGRRALDEFLDNRVRVMNHIVRHRLATGLWSQVGGVYFYGLFCGRRSKRTFNGVRLGIQLATSDALALESGVWEIWITAEPAVHRFEPVDWWQLLQAKEERGLFDFSGSKSDDLESLLQVVCLPNLSRGVVFDVQEDAFDRDRLQEANLQRGYLVGPQFEDEMVQYWWNTHLINLPSTNFVFVKVLMGGMVLTYPSWCVIRGQSEVVEATHALHGRILDSFADGLDAMDGITVLETTFTWGMLVDPGASSSHGNNCDTLPPFTTATGRVVRGATTSMSSSKEKEEKIEENTAGHTPVLSTPAPAARAVGGDGGDSDEGTARHSHRHTSIVTPYTPSAGQSSVPSDGSTAGATTAGAAAAAAAAASPESKVAAAAAQASIDVIRKSIIRRRGALPLASRKLVTPLAVQQPDEGGTPRREGQSHGRLSSAPFVIRRAFAGVGGGGGGQLGNRLQYKGPRKKKSLCRTVDLSGSRVGRGSGVAVDDDAVPVQVHQGNQPDGGNGGGSIEESNTRSSSSSSSGKAPVRIVTPGTGTRDAREPSDASCAENKAVSEGNTAETPRSGKKPCASNGKKRKRLATTTAVRSTSGASGAQYLAASSRGSSSSSGGGGGGATGNAGQNLAAVAGESLSEEADEGARVKATPQPLQSAPPAHEEPTKLCVTFSSQGSLGMGMESKDESEFALICGRAPTSAAAGVPVGWYITEVGGKSMRNVPGNEIAQHLRIRPVIVTFEKHPPPGSAAAGKAQGKKKSKTAPAAPASAAASDGTLRKRGSAKQAKQPTKKAKSKKAAKVTTVRKAFKVQSVRVDNGAVACGSTGGVGGASTGHDGGVERGRKIVPPAPVAAGTAVI